MSQLYCGTVVVVAGTAVSRLYERQMSDGGGTRARDGASDASSVLKFQTTPSCVSHVIPNINSDTSGFTRTVTVEV